MVGASAVMYYAECNKPAQTIQYQLGQDTEYSTDNAEAVGVTLGCWMLRNSSRLGPLSSSIYTDSKNVIKATTTRTPKSGSYLVEELNKIAAGLMGHEQIQYHGEKFTLRWIPAHKNITGNETADMEAQRAAAGEQLAPQSLLLHYLRNRKLPISPKHLKSCMQISLNDEATRQWNTSHRKQSFANIDTGYPFNNFRKIQNTMTRTKANIYMQLRTGHIPLNSYLHHFGKSDSS
ncbi:hypothetical protein CVT25_013881 [Psilocybe cyanescens]|uniref:RNase H type-1 domain-containing protein n=1 Tax=Psilocybe cyanescens TaxID=93625 RepID=A0A409XL34_PSICY|nr:hypothetical protein CVT25_013881 [Psilocybe cyanescens]